jgi:hypothetical protein
MANRESATSWKEFLLGLKRRGLRGVVFAVSDDHPGLKRAIIEVLPEAYWQRCYVQFLRNALDYLPRKVADDCLIELLWLYDRRNAEEARRDLAAWLLQWQERYQKLCARVEENIEETLTFYRLPREHHSTARFDQYRCLPLRGSSSQFYEPIRPFHPHNRFIDDPGHWSTDRAYQCQDPRGIGRSVAERRRCCHPEKRGL